ncbi:TIM barrel protein [Mumia zhuanghuii]|uniref:TIM barrel protein n=2 Tax=Mumia TaxID=1546255 RepID=A0ABW1QK46_9ACTN|nr:MULTISPECIES: TIM barrel protein [Mumia]KAA1423513.1 TIM barrel protein [Mumia zhuanghuii]
MVRSRIAGAPISWGVCEVAGWGFQMERERVLDEMRELGLAATEFGPEGWLPEDPQARAQELRAHGLQAVGGFLPIVLHDPTSDPTPDFDDFADACVAAGAEVVVLAAATGVNGYDARPTLSESEWATLCANLDALHDRARARGLRAVLHPHVGTLVEGAADLEVVLTRSRVALCVDTGHLMAAGVDPVQLTKDHVDRVAHVHLKDVDAALATEVHAGRVAFSDAVRAGLFRPLGTGDVDVAGMVTLLEGHGYDGWYVLEQDVMLDGDPAGPGPVGDVRASLAYLEGIAS